MYVLEEKFKNYKTEQVKLFTFAVNIRHEVINYLLQCNIMLNFYKTFEVEYVRRKGLDVLVTLKDYSTIMIDNVY